MYLCSGVVLEVVVLIERSSGFCRMAEPNPERDVTELREWLSSATIHSVNIEVALRIHSNTESIGCHREGASMWFIGTSSQTDWAAPNYIIS